MTFGQPQTRFTSSSPYSVAATRPLHVLVFLIPLMLLYEAGSVLYLAREARGADTIGAHGILRGFFQTFGAASLHLPPLALSVVLLAWHLLLKDPWRVRPRVLGLMAVESALWTIPLLVMGLLLTRPPAAAAVQDGTLQALSWQARLTISLGAGIYEELLFRLVMIGAIHFVLVDLLRAKHAVGAFAAALVSSLAFAFYHDVSGPGGVNLRLVLFFSLAGLYFSTVFITRGFGVVVATHALYDIVALLVFTRER